MEIKSETRGSQSGQIDHTLYVEQEGKVIAYLNFSTYKGDVAIQMIRVADAYKRKGIGAKLLRDLQGRYPDTEIDLGGLTDEGAALISSLTFKTIVDPKADKLLRLQARIKGHLEAPANLPADQKPKDSERWNRLHDMNIRLDDELEYQVRTKKIIS